MRRSHALAGVLLACGLVASSCGGDSESDGKSTGGKGGTGKGGTGGGGTSATGGTGNTGGGTSGSGGASGGGGGSGDASTQCGTMTCASDQACCPGLEYCYPATCTNCCPSVIDGGSGGSGGGTGTGGGTGDGGPQQCGFQTCGPTQSCCSLGTVQYCYQTSCTFCCQGGFDGGFGGFGGGGFDGSFGGFGNFGGFGGGGFDASFGGFGNFGGGPTDGGAACGAIACGNGFSCCKNQYCYPSACLACCQP